MGIPILDELNNEIARLFIAGSSLAKGDPRVKKYIASLQKLGERVPVFSALASKIEKLTNCDEKDSPEILMETSMILNSILYTQGVIDTQAFTENLNFSDIQLTFEKIPYSKLHQIVEILNSSTEKYDDSIKEIYESGIYNDRRLYQSYINSIKDKRTYVSNFVEDTILPSIGNDIVPLIEKNFNINGNKKDARLFKILYSIKKKDIIPLALKSVESSQEHIVVEALYSLSEDIQYEDILISYIKDKKANVRRAAFTSLIKLNSEQGEKYLLEAIKKSNINDIQESLLIADSKKIVEAIILEVKKEMENYNIKAVKIKNLLEVIARRDDIEGLEYIKSILTDLEFYEKASEVLDLYRVGHILEEGHTTEKDKILYDICNINEAFNDIKILVTVRMFSREKVYEELEDIFVKFNSLYSSLIHNLGVAYIDVNPYTNYSISEYILDANKKWDRRWGRLLIKCINCKNLKSYDFNNLILISKFTYDDDEDTWEKIMSTIAKLRKTSGAGYYNYMLVLAQMIKNNHPKSEQYYNEIIKYGYKNDTVLETLKDCGLDLNSYNLK